MRIKENLFWGLILVLFFLGGYLHGSLPFSKIKRLLNPDKQLRILIHSPSLLPEELLQKLQKKSYTLRIDPVQYYDDLKVELLKSPGPDLILIPHSWVAPLQKENLLLRTSNSLFNEFAVDFQNHKNLFYPWFWFVTKSFSIAEKNSDVISADSDSTYWIETLINDGPALIKHESKNVFLPHVMKIENTHSSFVPGKSKLWVFGWSLPKTAESAEDSLNLLKDLYEYPIYESALLTVPAASVLKRTDSEPWEHWKKPQSLRDLPFDQITIKE